MKKYYLFLIILFALKCSIIAQKVEPSRTYNLIEKCYCTSFKQVGKLYNGTIVYVCTKCGKETMANPNGVGGTIEDIIEQNKREAKLAELMKNPSQASNAEAAKMLGTIVPSTITKQQEEAIKKIQKSQNVSNQQKPKTTSKPQSKTTSKPSTTTKKQQSSTKKSNVSPTKNTTPNATSKPSEPTAEENLGKISDGIDAAIDMVKKISNKDGTNNTTLKENYNPNQERGLKEALRYNNKSSPNYDPNKEWSGSEADLQELAKIMKEKFLDEAWSHLGRDVASLKPFSLNEMIYELINGNPNGWEVHVWDKFHQDNGKSNFRVSNISDPEEILEFIAKQIQKGDKNLNIKFVRDDAGDEVVYNLTTREIIKNEKMGTFNKSALAKQQYENNVQLAQKAYEEWQQDHPIQSTKIPVFAGGVKAGVGVFQIKEEINAWKANVAVIGEHQTLDMDTNDTKAIPGNSFTRDGDQYKYVGILYERDKNDPNKFYIINGQTGEKMTAKQAYEFAATISDMWVNENHKQSVIDPLRNPQVFGK